MHKEEIILFGFSIILFILLQPNLFVKIPSKYHMYFVFFHCLVFALAFFTIKVTITSPFINTQENFTDKDVPDLEKKRAELEKIFKNYSAEEMEKLDNSEILKKMEDITKDMTENQKKSLHDFLLSSPDSKAIKISGSDTSSNALDKEIKLNKKIDHIGEIASVEQIQYFDSLSKSQQNALEKILDNMNMEDIEKYLKLDVDKLSHSIQEVVKVL